MCKHGCTRLCRSMSVPSGNYIHHTYMPMPMPMPTHHIDIPLAFLSSSKKLISPIHAPESMPLLASEARAPGKVEKEEMGT